MVKLNIGTLKRISIVYLSLGHLIFFIGWLKPLYAVPAVILLLTAYFIYFRDTKTNETIAIQKRNFVWLLLSILVWVLFSGSGGFGYQFDDYYKHNALMSDFIDQQWPVSYQIDGKLHYLCHYLGIYLPAPTLFGWISWRASNIAQFVFNYLGIFLALIWMFRFVGKYHYWLVILFMLFSGIQVFTFFYMNADVSLKFLFTDHIKMHRNTFWYNSFKLLNLAYEGNTSLFYWAPQHAIPCWLGMGLFISDWQVEKSVKYSPFYLSLLAFWTPLVLVGIAPFFLFALLETRFKGIFNWVNLVIATTLFGITSTYILAIDSGDFIKNFTINSSRPNLTIIEQLGIYLFFLTMEIFVWWIPSYIFIKEKISAQRKRLFIFTLIILVLIPLYRYGVWNDWCIRVSMPALFVMWAMVMQAFVEVKSVSRKVVLITLLVLGSFDTVLNIGGSMYHYLQHYRTHHTLWPLKTKGANGDVPAICVGYPVQQFVARPDTFFFKYLAKNK